MKRVLIINKQGQKEFFLLDKEVRQINKYLGGCNVPGVLQYLGTIVSEFDHGFEELSIMTGISKEGLYKALSKEGNPKMDTWLPIFEALGIAPQVEKDI